MFVGRKRYDAMVAEADRWRDLYDEARKDGDDLGREVVRLGSINLHLEGENQAFKAEVGRLEGLVRVRDDAFDRIQDAVRDDAFDRIQDAIGFWPD